MRVLVLTYTDAEIATILAAYDQIGRSDYARLRARAMVLLLYYTGLRISDVAMPERDRVRNGEILVPPIFLATLAIRQQSRVIRFRSAARMLDTFCMQQGGTHYRRLMCAFQRIFGAWQNGWITSVDCQIVVRQREARPIDPSPWL